MMDEPTLMRIDAADTVFWGDLDVPHGACGQVLFAHASGSSRHSLRNQQVVEVLQRSHLGTLLFDLLSAEEEEIDEETHCLRTDIPRLAQRLLATTDWVLRQPDLGALGLGYFGSGTGAAAALVAAAERRELVRAVVTRGGRTDLAGPALERVVAPTLLIVGERDPDVLAQNREAAARLGGPVELVVVPEATHRFEEPGALEEVARRAADWFARHLCLAPDVCGVHARATLR